MNTIEPAGATTASEFYAEQLREVTIPETGHRFTIRRVALEELYDLGMFLLPDKGEVVDVTKYTPAQLEGMKTEDKQKLVYEYIRMLLVRGVTSIKIIVDPKMAADPEAGEVHYYWLPVADRRVLPREIDEFSGFKIFSTAEADAPFRGEAVPVGAGDGEQAQVGTELPPPRDGAHVRVPSIPIARRRRTTCVED